MSAPSFQHIKTEMVDDVAVVEVLTKELRFPDLARELADELDLVARQEWASKLLLDFRRTKYLSSTGFAVLFNLAKRAGEAGRQLKICNMDPEVRIGADIIGLGKVVELHDTEATALTAFRQN